MNSPNPVPSTQTPLPSEWNSAIIRQLAYGGLGLIATILADIFNLSTTAFLEKGGRVIDAVLSFAVIAVPLYLAYRARKNQPTPPIAGTPGVEASIAREEAIAAAPNQMSKMQAMKCSPIAVIGALILALVSVTVLPGCTGTRDAFKAAQTTTSASAVEATAYVIGEQYAATVTEAAALKNAGTLTGAKLEAVRRADDLAKPLFLGDPATGKPGLRQAVDAYKAVKSAKTLEDLQKASNAAVIQLSKLIDALKAGKVLR